jgi:glyoxylase-like metal-dependent hydrolase (beta-lactamase superfamily II)
VLLILVTINVFSAHGLKLKKVSNSVYAIVGQLSNRNILNLGNNSTHGFIITKKGIILIDAGGTYNGAKAIHDIIKTVSKKPIKIVINTGGQDHRWFGNSYFKKLGANIISSIAMQKDGENRASFQMSRMEKLTSKKVIKNTNPIISDYAFKDKMFISFGGVNIEIYHKGSAHTLGDAFVWMPKEKIMFSGDIVFSQRMLGIKPNTSYKSWIHVFEEMAKFNPKTIIPGHGEPTTLKIATNDTYDYLKFLDSKVQKIIDDDGDLSELSTVNQDKFKYLKNFSSQAKKNLSQAFMQVEAEQF